LWQIFSSFQNIEAIFDDFACERRYIYCKRLQFHRLYIGSPRLKGYEKVINISFNKNEQLNTKDIKVYQNAMKLN